MKRYFLFFMINIVFISISWNAAGMLHPNSSIQPKNIKEKYAHVRLTLTKNQELIFDQEYSLNDLKNAVADETLLNGRILVSKEGWFKIEIYFKEEETGLNFCYSSGQQGTDKTVLNILKENLDQELVSFNLYTFGFGPDIENFRKNQRS